MTKKVKEKSEFATVKIRAGTYRIIQTISAWRKMSVLDYVDDLVRREGLPDLYKVMDEIGELKKEKKKGPSVAPKED